MAQTIEYHGVTFEVSKAKYIKVTTLTKYSPQGVAVIDGKAYLLVLGHPTNKAFLLR